MTVNEMIEAFERFSSEYIKFEEIENKLSTRADMHAFILLTTLVPGDSRDIVAAAEHDEICLDVDLNKLAEVITEDSVRDLVRCGVSYNDEYDCLYMFV